MLLWGLLSHRGYWLYVPGCISVLTLFYLLSITSHETQPLFQRPPRIPTSSSLSPPPLDPYAYVFYATEENYLCSALVAATHLRRLNAQHPIIVLVSPNISVVALEAVPPLNITIVQDKPPEIPYANAIPYYSDVLLKLRAFRLHRILPHLKRIIVLDSDQLILRNLDPLFELPPVDVAAPVAYWLGDEGLKSVPGVTSTLMLVQPNDETWGIVERGMQNMTAGMYDMDVVNKVFASRTMVLPGRFCTLNSHWEAGDLPAWFAESGEFEVVDGKERKKWWGVDAEKGDDDDEVDDMEMHNGDEQEDKKEKTKEVDRLEKLWDTVEVLHFTAVGKPWTVEVVEPDPEPSENITSPVERGLNHKAREARRERKRRAKRTSRRRSVKRQPTSTTATTSPELDTPLISSIQSESPEPDADMDVEIDTEITPNPISPKDTSIPTIPTTTPIDTIDAADTSTLPPPPPPTPIMMKNIAYLIDRHGDSKMDVHPRLVDAFRIWKRDAKVVCKALGEY